MEYHLHGQGRDLGVFPLEELQRRRQSGGLTGTELVWREGMAQWQSLDSILSAAPAATRSMPPPLPASALKKNPNSLVAWVVAGGIVMFLAGASLMGVLVVKVAQRLRVQSQGATGNDLLLASKPIVWNTNSLTEREVQKRAKAFRVREYIDGYKERGHRDTPCDAESLQFLRTWIDSYYGGAQTVATAKLQELADKLVSSANCDDPLVLTATAVTGPELHESIYRLERALKDFGDSRYRAYPQFYATVVLANDVRDDPGRVEVLDATALALFKKAFHDGSFRPQDQPELAEILVNGWGYNFFTRKGAVIASIAQKAGKPYEWLGLVLEGEHEVVQAWRSRGGGYGNTVSQASWQAFETHSEAAQDSFTRAWTLRPDLPLAPERMVYVAMGISGLEEMRLWFDRTTAAQIDYPRAWTDMRWGLRPRWHGSLESMRALGVAAINTRRFDTDVPRKFFDVVTDMESESHMPYGQHIYGREDIWPQFQQMYEGYLAAPSETNLIEGWRTSFSVVAYLAGHYDVARKQLEKLKWRPLQNSLEGWDQDLSLMSLEVASRTGPMAVQVNSAEEASKMGNVTAALQAYQALSHTPGLDELTSRYVDARIAALKLEQALQQGGWVDFLPKKDEDPAWVCLRGKYHCIEDGSVEIEAGPTGYLLFPRARIGSNFEVRGEFEPVRSSNHSFQAGLVAGMPDLRDYDFYAFRMKRNENEGEVASLSYAWSKRQLERTVKLNDSTNSFQLRFEEGRATASFNDLQIFRDAKIPGPLRVPRQEFMAGLGAFNDSNQTVVRYRHVQIRRH